MIRILHIDEEETNLISIEKFLDKISPEIQVTSVHNAKSLIDLNLEDYQCLLLNKRDADDDPNDFFKQIDERHKASFMLNMGRGSELGASVIGEGKSFHIEKGRDSEASAGVTLGY